MCVCATNTRVSISFKRTQFTRIAKITLMNNSVSYNNINNNNNNIITYTSNNNNKNHYDQRYYY